MRVLVAVTGRPLDIRGVRYNVGERLFLDTKNAQHRAVLSGPGWVERVPARRTPQSAALNGPPVDRMVSASVTKQASPTKGNHQKRGTDEQPHPVR